jgi:CubicO group peptidase (beta-lactamase class C family)
MRSRKMPLALSIALLCANVSVAQKKAAAAPAQVDPASKLQGLDNLAAQAMQQWKVPGLALGVVKDGKLIYAKGYGFRDLEHNRKTVLQRRTNLQMGARGQVVAA